MTKKKTQAKPANTAKPAETVPAPETDAKTDTALKAAPSRFRIFLIDALVAILAFIAIRGAAAKICDTYAKVRWAIDVIGKIDQLGPDFADLIPPPPSGRKDSGAKDLAGWIRQNLPRAGAADYRRVGEIFMNTAAKLRAGELDGKREAFADTARELIRAVDRAVWTPFMAALAAREESAAAETNAELAGLFETAGKTISGEAATPLEEGAPRIE